MPRRQEMVIGDTQRVGRVLRFFPVVGLGTSPSSHAGGVHAPPFGSGGGTLACGKGEGGVPVPNRGDIMDEGTLKTPIP